MSRYSPIITDSKGLSMLSEQVQLVKLATIQELTKQKNLSNRRTYQIEESTKQKNLLNKIIYQREPTKQKNLPNRTYHKPRPPPPQK